MTAPSIVTFTLHLSLSSNDLPLLETLANLHGLTPRDLLVATLQASLSQEALTRGLTYRRAWHDATRLVHLLQSELDALHEATTLQPELTAQQVLEHLWPPDPRDHPH